MSPCFEICKMHYAKKVTLDWLVLAKKKKCLQLNVCACIELEGMSMCAVFGWDLICFEVFLSGKSSVTTKPWHRVFQIFRIIKKSMCPTEIDDALWCFGCVCSCSLFSLTLIMSTWVQKTEFVFLKRRQFSRAGKLKQNKSVLFVTFQSAQVGVQVNGSRWGLTVDRCHFAVCRVEDQLSSPWDWGSLQGLRKSRMGLKRECLLEWWT